MFVYMGYLMSLYSFVRLLLTVALLLQGGCLRPLYFLFPWRQPSALRCCHLKNSLYWAYCLLLIKSRCIIFTHEVQAHVLIMNNFLSAVAVRKIWWKLLAKVNSFFLILKVTFPPCPPILEQNERDVRGEGRQKWIRGWERDGVWSFFIRHISLHLAAPALRHSGYLSNLNYVSHCFYVFSFIFANCYLHETVYSVSLKEKGVCSYLDSLVDCTSTVNF